MIELTQAEKDRLDGIFAERVCNVEAKDEHWIHGSDEGLSYCYECATKKVAELLEKEPDEEYEVDGGWGIDGDSTPFCQTCRALLSNSLTQYACEEDIKHFVSNGFDPQSDSDCYSMAEVISSSGWGPLVFEHQTDHEQEELREYYEKLHELGRQILAKLDAAASAQEVSA